MPPIPIAVVGVGAFGRQHARVLASVPGANLVAVADHDPERAATVAAEFGCEALTDHKQLAGRVAAAVVAVPTALHSEVGTGLLESGFSFSNPNVVESCGCGESVKFAVEPSNPSAELA